MSLVADNSVCKILIIGAGMAGLSAASHLLKHNMTDFKVLEARKRIGGRIVSVESEVSKMELGASWIHGVLGNPMYEIATAHGLIDIVHTPKPHKVVAATENGKQVPFKILQEICEAYMCFLHRCEEYFLCQYMPPPGVVSVGEHLELEVTLYLERIADVEERRLRRLIFDCLLKRETCISGCDTMADIDLFELGSYTELQGGNISLPAGYSSILAPVSRTIPPDKLLMSHAVTAIRWDHGMSTVRPGSDNDNDSDDSDRTVTEVPTVSMDRTAELQCENHAESRSNVEVICSNGARLYADHVICTMPLGVLKRSALDIFSPPLPNYKLEAIERLLFGTVNKIFLIYERPFLNPDISEVMLLWNSDSLKGDLSVSWYKKIYSFSKITETLLLGWVSGREAEYMETLTQQEVADQCTDILRKFLNDPYVPKPKQCVRTHWHSEEYTGGSYTAMAVGASQTDIEYIAQPLYSFPEQSKPVLLFAGEHTHSSFYSTVHGAYLTGRSSAQLLLETPGLEVVVDASDLSSWVEGISLD